MFWLDFADSFRRRQRSSPISTCQTLPKAASIRAREKRFAYLDLIAIRVPRHRVRAPSGRSSRWWVHRTNFSYYVTGTLILLGVLLGRFVCGFLCPFGWLQELLHKIPCKKFSTKKLKPLTYIKYVVLLFAVVLLPVLVVNDVGMGDPFFCKYICPQGVLEAIPLAAVNAGIRSALGQLLPGNFRSHCRGGAERFVLSPLLQMDLPARRILCAHE